MNTKRSRGFTLVETLIALVVLSIGLLGVAALQLSSLRMNSSAAMRSQATLLAYDIVDRMRANQLAARGGAYDIAYAVTPSGSTLAATDLTSWRANVTNTLGPTAQSQITRDVTGSAPTFIVSIQWADIDDTGTARAPVVFSMETQL